MSTDFGNHYLVREITVRIPINDKATKDIEINVNIAFQDFLNCMCANMGLDLRSLNLVGRGPTTHNDGPPDRWPLKMTSRLPSLTFSSWRTVSTGWRKFLCAFFTLWVASSLILCVISLLHRIPTELKRQMGITPPISCIVKSCPLCRRSYAMLSTLVHIVGAMSALRTRMNTSNWDWKTWHFGLKSWLVFSFLRSRIWLNHRLSQLERQSWCWPVRRTT